MARRKKSKKINNDKNIYAVLVRVSSDRQASEGDSIEMQENLAEAFIEKEGGSIFKIYVEPAVSASKTRLADRKVLMECLGDAQAGRFGHLVVYRRDRLVRNAEESLVIRRLLDESDVLLHFTARGEQQIVADDVYAPIVENLRATMDEMESVQISIRVSDVLNDKVKRGEFIGGGLPYGYEYVNEMVVPIESEIPIIKEIEDLYLQGNGIYSIAKYLNGLETKIGKRSPRERKRQRKTDSAKWTKDVITTIIGSPFYSGYLKYIPRDKEEYEYVKSSQIIPIRSVEDQKRLNKIRVEKKQFAPRKYSTSYLLTGLLTCADCGDKMISSVSSKSTSENVYFYYKCLSRGNPHQFCNSKSLKKELAEEAICNEAKSKVNQFIQSDMHSEIKKRLSSDKGEYEQEIDNVKKNLEKKNKEFATIRRFLFELDTEDLSYDILKKNYQEDQKNILLEMNQLEKDVLELEGRISVSENTQTSIETITEQLEIFNEVFDEAPLNLKKRLLEELFVEMTVDKDYNAKVELSFDSLLMQTK